MNELINRMASDVSSMSLAEKMIGGLIVTLFSMVIVAIVLVIIMFAIKFMTASLSDRPKKIKESDFNITQNEQTIQPDISSESTINKDEEIAAVMAALSSYYASGETKIVIKNIARNEKSSWANAGMLEQLNSRL